MKAMLMLCCCAVFYTAGAQSSDPIVVASAGGVNQNSILSLEWTLGETSIATLDYKDGMITQGFHQPVVLSANKRPEIVQAIIKDIRITVAPNPVMSKLTVKFNGSIQGKLSLILVNVSGKQLFRKDHIAKNNVAIIAMEQLPAGIYFLKVADDRGPLKTFEIIKL